MSLLKPKSTRKGFQDRVLAASPPGGEEGNISQYGITLMKAGISPATVAFLLEVNDKSVRRWFLGTTIPRRADLTRLIKLAARASSAMEKGALPSRGITLLELAKILEAQKGG